MGDVQDEPLFADRVAGLDIAKAGVEATVRVPGRTPSTASGRSAPRTSSPKPAPT
jgi:hypothetical protein